MFRVLGTGWPPKPTLLGSIPRRFAIAGRTSVQSSLISCDSVGATPTSATLHLAQLDGSGPTKSVQSRFESLGVCFVSDYGQNARLQPEVTAVRFRALTRCSCPKDGN